MNEKCMKLFKEGKAILVCPEQLGGLSTPRNPVELDSSAKSVVEDEGKAVDNTGKDVTKQFLDGAYETLRIARKRE